MKKAFIYFVFLVLIGLSSCGSLETNVEVELPKYERKLVVECYLEKGKPYRLLLTESVGYTDPEIIPFVNRAFVTISRNGQIDTLKYQTTIDSLTFKIYNYSSSKILSDTSDVPFDLYIKDRQGRVVTASTRFTPPLIIDSIYYKFSASQPEKARITARVKANPTEENVYRFFLNVKDSITGTQSSRILDDRLLQNGEINTTTTYRFDKGDSVWVNVHRVDKAYQEYYSSVRGAFNANFNPFSQPISIKGNINGGIGIFTAIKTHRRRLIIGQ
jgi:hypothetical protein